MFPTYVGMNRPYQVGRMRQVYVPHIRGDEPPASSVPTPPSLGSEGCPVRWSNRIPRKQECQLLAGLLTHLENGLGGDYDWRIVKGVEMGQPSELRAREQKQKGVLTTSKIDQICIQVAEDNLHI